LVAQFAGEPLHTSPYCAPRKALSQERGLCPREAFVSRAVLPPLRFERTSPCPVNISKLEQRVLHVLAQGGFIRHTRCDGEIVAVDCFTREGYRLADCTLSLFRKLKRRGLIVSREGAPYRISALGLASVRAQLDNR
jgi:hypothetical protein